MKVCTICDYTVKNGPVNDSVYCPGCGNRLVVGSASDGYESPAAAPRGARLIAALIDFVIGAVLVAIGLVPGVNILASLIDTAFWLLRDINGASPGKAIMGLEVKTQGGRTPTKFALMLRNLPFAPLIIQIIPVIGNIILPIVGLIAFIELILILVSDRRIGDYLAGTKVMKKTAAPRAWAAGAGH